MFWVWMAFFNLAMWNHALRFSPWDPGDIQEATEVDLIPGNNLLLWISKAAVCMASAWLGSWLHLTISLRGHGHNRGCFCFIVHNILVKWNECLGLEMSVVGKHVAWFVQIAKQKKLETSSALTTVRVLFFAKLCKKPCLSHWAARTLTFSIEMVNLLPWSVSGKQMLWSLGCLYSTADHLAVSS